MISLTSRPILSSICIEPVDSEEYNQNLVEELTVYHKQKFLHYLKIEPNILNGKVHIKTLLSIELDFISQLN